jgi:hypothetical protein
LQGILKKVLKSKRLQGFYLSQNSKIFSEKHGPIIAESPKLTEQIVATLYVMLSTVANDRAPLRTRHKSGSQSDLGEPMAL